jgi:hypothetical protein
VPPQSGSGGAGGSGQGGAGGAGGSAAGSGGSSEGGSGGSSVAGSGGDGGEVSCSVYGQQCSQGSDCCSDIPCSSGYCLYPLL